MSKPIRILHVIGIMNRGGAEAMIMNLYREIDTDKIQFDFVENSYEEAAHDEEITKLGGRIYRCPHYNGFNHFEYVKWWEDFFQKHADEYSVVHGHIGSTAAIYLSIAKKYNVWTIAHSHNTTKGSLMYRFYSYFTRHVADEFFACSKQAGLDRFGKRIANNKALCHIFHNAIDTSKFISNKTIGEDIRKQLGIPLDSLVVGHVGRFAEAKNHMFLIDIFKQLHKMHPNSYLLLVGDGNLRDQIENKISLNNLEKHIILTGVQEDVHKFYQAMNVFVFPSLYEGLPVSLIESQSAGLPCVVSKNVPNDVAITELVEFLDLSIEPRRWAEIILDKAKFERVNTQAEIIKAGYDISDTTKWLTSHYESVGK